MQEELTALENEQLLLKHLAEQQLGIDESTEQYRKMIRAAIAQFVKNLQSGQIEITVDDFLKLVEYDLKLQQQDL
ncbi:hypothetical protein [Tumebacillus amylolyticus]|nr:hypothetical protein [Tumebacillus amylolyticus]